MNILVFEDDLVPSLSPATTGRPAFAITVATYHLADWLRLLDGPIAAIVRHHLRALLHVDDPGMQSRIDERHGLTLLVNARIVPNQNSLHVLRELRGSNEIVCVRTAQGAMAAAVVSTTDVIQLFGKDLGFRTLQAIEAGLQNLPASDWTLEMLEYPHDIVRHNLADFSASLTFRLSQGNYREISEGIFVSGEVAISDFVVTNTSGGPIVIESGTVIGPFCFLRGPIHIGAGSRINEHSAIKDFVSIGHTCKIGGEVEGSVIEPYSNKQHHGFLGHSYLGSWINLGAGTCNSDLKNTYGEVKMEYRGERIATGMQFIGCIMGDYSKTAINTSIFTGKTIGVCSMLYGFVTTNVPSFSNYARTFSQMTESPPAVMELTQKRMFARRNVQQRQLDIDLLHAMYDLTRHERQISEEPLNL